MVRPLRWQAARVVDNVRETARAARLRLDAPGWPGHLPGQHTDVRLTAEDGYSAQRSYSIASPPERDGLELIVERLQDGEVSPYLTDELRAGDQLELRGPIGGYFVWHRELGGPVQLIAGGSGVVPFLAMLGHPAAGAGNGDGAAAMRLLYSARAHDDLLAGAELEAASGSGAEVTVTLTRSAPPGWTGLTGRVDGALLQRCVFPPAAAPTVFVCGAHGVRRGHREPPGRGGPRARPGQDRALRRHRCELRRTTVTDHTPDPAPSRTLDGNAAAGPLAEIFLVEPTVVRSTCAHCGTPAALGAHQLFADAPGAVVRCPSCTEVVLRFARVGDGRLALDLRGSALLVFPAG